mgnify:CR=1 FL=1
MDIEPIIWGYLPIALALVFAAFSFQLVLRKRSLSNVLFFLLILGGNSLAVYILVQILMGAWPTYTPHIIIAFSILLFFVQRVIHRKAVVN